MAVSKQSAEANYRIMHAINRAWIEERRPPWHDNNGWWRIADRPEVMMNINDLHILRGIMRDRPIDTLPFPRIQRVDGSWESLTIDSYSER